MRPLLDVHNRTPSGPFVMVVAAGALCAVLIGCGESYSQYLPEPTERRIDSLAEATRQDLVFVKGGTFQMGDVGAYFVADPEPGEYYTDSASAPAGAYYAKWTPETDDEPAHGVTLSSYSIQAHEVTYGAYDLFTQATNREPTLIELLGRRERRSRYPAGASWNQARAYCRWMGEQMGVEMDLPTEAQWEYAARSRGKNVAAATSDGVPRPGENMVDSGWDMSRVGTYPPNLLGLYNMSDNVREWTTNWYSRNYYRKMKQEDTVVTDPRGPKTGEKKVMRGGGVVDTPTMVRLYLRYSRDPSQENSAQGFRCVANSNEPIE